MTWQLARAQPWPVGHPDEIPDLTRSILTPGLATLDPRSAEPPLLGLP